MSNFLHDFSGAFSKAPQRSVFDLSHEVKTSFNAGYLVPIDVVEVMPRDHFQGNASGVVRLAQTPLFPVMDDMYLDIFHFFVPYRIMWKYWEQFEGENKSTAGVSTTEYVLPTQIIQTVSDSTGTGNPNVPGDVFDYLGYGALLGGAADNYSSYLNVFDLVGYCWIWNYFFRSEDLDAPLSGLDTFYNLASGTIGSATRDPNAIVTGYINYSDTLSTYFTTARTPLKVNKYHDYFTSCLTVQSGNTVFVNLGDKAPVKALGHGSSGTVVDSSDLHSTGAPIWMTNVAVVGSSTIYPVGDKGLFGSSGISVSPSNETNLTNLYADLSAASGISIAALQLSIATQNYWNLMLTGGSRYTESRRSLFGANLRNDMISRPEYLGGEHIRLNMNQVANTSTANSEPIGKMGAYSLTGFTKKGGYEKEFKERGLVYTLATVRVKHTYSQGVSPTKLRSRLFDFFNPLFDRIANQPAYKDQIYHYGHTSSPGYMAAGSVFGYQEAWADYRQIPDRATGAIAPGIYQDLTGYTYGDNYTAAPSLSRDWMKENRGNIQQTLDGSDSPLPLQFIADFRINIKAVRPMNVYSKPSRLGM